MQDSVAPVSMSRINEMTAGDPSFLKEIVDLYLMDATELVSELKKHVGAADAKSVQTVAHKLKGSTAQAEPAESIAKLQTPARARPNLRAVIRFNGFNISKADFFAGPNSGCFPANNCIISTAALIAKMPPAPSSIRPLPSLAT